MKPYKKVMILFSGFTLLIVIFLVSVFRSMYGCINATPAVPIFSQSVLIDYETLHQSIASNIVEQRYSVAASPQDVVAFYETNSVCRHPNSVGTILCRGENIEAVYYAYIYPSSAGETNYTVEVSWTCEY